MENPKAAMILALKTRRRRIEMAGAACPRSEEYRVILSEWATCERDIAVAAVQCLAL